MSVHKEKARLLIQQQRWDMAKKEIGEALRETPEDADCYILLGQCLHHLKKYEESFECLRKAIALEPLSAYAHYYLGWTYFDRSLKEKLHQTEFLSWARAEAEEALRLIPEQPSYLALLANIQFNNRKFKKALVAAEKGLALDPNHQGCLHLRSLALSELKKSDQAEETVERSLEINPEERNAFATQGWIYWNKSQFKKAMESFQEALRLDPTNSWAQRGLLKAELACHRFNGWAYTYQQVYSRWYWRVIAFSALLGTATIFFPHLLAPIAIPVGIIVLGMMVLASVSGILIYSWEEESAFQKTMPDQKAKRKRILLLSLGGAAGLAIAILKDQFWGRNDDAFFFHLFVPCSLLFFIYILFKRPKGLPITRRDKTARGILGAGVLLVGIGLALSKSPWISWSDPLTTTGVVIMLLAILFAVFAKKWAGSSPK